MSCGNTDNFRKVFKKNTRQVLESVGYFLIVETQIVEY